MSVSFLGFLFFIRPIVLEVNPVARIYKCPLQSSRFKALIYGIRLYARLHITSDTCVMVFVAIVEARHMLLFLLLATTGNLGRRSSFNY